jgi:HEAT repeats
MEQERIDELIIKYNEGQADPAEIKLIEQLLEEGKIELYQLRELSMLEEQVIEMKSPVPSSDLDDNFYQMLKTVKAKSKGFSWGSLFSWPELAPKLAFASVTLVMGFLGGYFFFPSPSSNKQVEILTSEVQEMKEMMMFSMLQQESATERLKAVSLTSEMTTVSAKVTNALLQTLNNDENLNVRLEALEALKPFVRDSRIRAELVRSIGKQDSPLVLIALAELMQELQEKSSVKELQKAMKSDKTPLEVKKRIEESIKTMT